jgi:hypothetical protein
VCLRHACRGVGKVGARVLPQCTLLIGNSVAVVVDVDGVMLLMPSKSSSTKFLECMYRIARYIGSELLYELFPSMVHESPIRASLFIRHRRISPNEHLDKSRSSLNIVLGDIISYSFSAFRFITPVSNSLAVTH